MNPHDGAVLLEHAGRTATLRFSWGAIEAIRADWGDDYAKRMGEAMDTPKLEDVAHLVAAIGDMKPAEVMAWSPPIAATSQAISRAWQLAWFGADEPAKADPKNPPMALAMLKALPGLSWLRRSAPASAGATSGH